MKSPISNKRTRFIPQSFAASAILMVLAAAPGLAHARPQWSEARASAWYNHQNWPVGSNYINSDAINQLEMWQADSFNPGQIDSELGLAEGAGMNSMRVFLQDQLWTQDSEGLKKRIDIFLNIAAKHHIKPLFVLFDSCWDPHPHLGKQPEPRPGVHNSGWVQSPGIDRLENTADYPELEAYVKGIVGTFGHDDRVLGFDVWNEPGNSDVNPSHLALLSGLLPQVFIWARSMDPIQPLTSGLYQGGNWQPSENAKLTVIQRIQLAQSDVISFHNYGWPEELEERIKQLKKYGRPILCTEYMARGAGSTIDGDLPVAKAYGVGMYNWGLVDGKTQTRFPWDSYLHPYTDREPTIWFHDLFQKDGMPYRQREIDILRKLTGYQPR